MPRPLILVPTELERQALAAALPANVGPLELCGFGAVAAAARTAQLLGRLAPKRVILVGIAGRFDERLAIGDAYRFSSVACHGIGVGSGVNFEPAAAMGWPQWPAAAGESNAIGDLLTLAPVSAADRDAGLLLTACAASATAGDAAARRRLFPDAAAEDMEGFGVAVSLPARGRAARDRAGHLQHGRRQGHRAVAGGRGARGSGPGRDAARGAVAMSQRVSPQAGFAVSPPAGFAVSPPAGFAVSPPAGFAVSPPAGFAVRLGISTCPNDTFAFHGLLTRAVDWRGLDFRVELLDIEELNTRMRAGEFDVCKVSFAAALAMADDVVVLPSGAALGFGVGPLLLAAAADTRPTLPRQLTLCPGAQTTAALLFELFHPRTTRVEQVVFSEIMPRLEAGTADFGVCIHEGRFTSQARGLHLVEDLGSRWETETGCPLPLGGIVAARRLPADVITRVQQVIHDSLRLALDRPDAALPTMRAHAQEFDDRVLRQHVALYVNEWTVDLGDVGRRALAEFSARAAAVGRGRPGMLEVAAL